MKNKLTDFQADWAAMPQVEKEQILKLKNKTIVVSGHSLARCLCYALIYQNETRNLGCKVVLCAQDKSLIDDLYPELILREDVTKLSAISQPISGEKSSSRRSFQL